MKYRFFILNVMIRTILIMLSAVVFAWLIVLLKREFIFTLIAGLMVILLQSYLLSQYVLRFYHTIEKFVESVGLISSSELRFGGNSLLVRNIQKRLNEIKQEVKKRGFDIEKQRLFIDKIVDSSDIGLLCLNQKDDLLFINSSARNFFPHHTINNLRDIKIADSKIWENIKELAPNHSRLIRIKPGHTLESSDKQENFYSLRLKEIRISDDKYKLISIHNIQEEIHKSESESWQKIIRVLTHEISNAIGPMLSLSKTIQKRLSNSDSSACIEQTINGLKAIENTGEGLLQFVSEYRRLSLLPPPKKERISVGQVLQSISILLESDLLRQNIRLEIKHLSPKVEVLADRKQFEIVIMNLLRNSIEALQLIKNGKIEIVTSVSGKKSLITISDNGPGIPKEIIDQVFVPFYTTKNSGSGIGLSLARQIMNNHDGSIQLESKPGKSTTVSLFF